MPNRKQNALFPIEAIGNDIGALAKLDHPFTELRRQIVDGTANLGMGGENPDALAYCLYGAPCGSRVLRRKKIVETSHITKR